MCPFSPPCDVADADRALQLFSVGAVAPATVLASRAVDFLEAVADMVNFSDYWMLFEMVGHGDRIEYLNAGKSSWAVCRPCLFSSLFRCVLPCLSTRNQMDTRQWALIVDGGLFSFRVSSFSESSRP